LTDRNPSYSSKNFDGVNGITLTNFFIDQISRQKLLVVEEAGVPGENHRPWPSNW
jgi:hypothetical protein